VRWALFPQNILNEPPYCFPYVDKKLVRYLNVRVQGIYFSMGPFSTEQLFCFLLIISRLPEKVFTCPNILFSIYCLTEILTNECVGPCVDPLANIT
jgi:hypothetical protein